MIVNKYGRVAGSIDLAALAEMYAKATDDDLKAHYRQVAAESGVDLDAAPAAEQPEAAPAAEPAEAEAERPAVNAPKADWVAYAVSKGADEADAGNATKVELIELYGQEG